MTRMMAAGFLRWTPRALCAALAVFLALFALDVFSEGLGLVGTIVALTIHLVPALGALVVLAVAWRWPLVGGIVMLVASMVYAQFVVRGHHPLSWALVIAGPAFLVGVLFLLDSVVSGRELAG